MIYKKGKKSRSGRVEEPVAVYSSRLRAIGNSKGVILNRRAIEIAGLDPGSEIIVQARHGTITIIQEKQNSVNTDLSTWDKQFKSAIKKGAKPETDFFDAMANEFDNKEW
jgi:hypothetical protein